MTSLNKNLITPVIVIAAIAIAGVFYFNQDKADLSSQEAAEKAIAFINQTIEENVTASLVEVVDDGNVYRVRLKIEEIEYDSYITKDGKLLFPTGFNLEGQEQESITGGSQEPASKEEFAKCIADSGAKFYGASWCDACESQKEMFGEAVQFLPYIECSDEETREMLPVCQEAGITTYPTWEINGEKTTGVNSFEQLAEITGCSL